MKVRIPKFFCPEARKLYQYVVSTFELEEHHMNLLFLACQARSRAEQARKEIAKHGLTMVDKYQRIVARPETAIEKNSMQIFSRLIRELNLSEDNGEMRRPPSLRYRDRSQSCR